MKTLAYIIMGAIAGAFFTFAVASWRAAPSPAVDLKTRNTVAAVAAEVRQFKKIETASATVEQMVQTNDGETIVVRGRTAAGFDLTDLPESSIEIDKSGNLTINLPPPQLFETQLDTTNTKIYDPKTKTFSIRSVGYSENLRAVGEAAVAGGACRADLLVKATENIEKMMLSTFGAVGFKNVATRTPPGKCE